MVKPAIDRRFENALIREESRNAVFFRKLLDRVFNIRVDNRLIAQGFNLDDRFEQVGFKNKTKDRLKSVWVLGRRHADKMINQGMDTQPSASAGLESAASFEDTLNIPLSDYDDEIVDTYADTTMYHYRAISDDVQKQMMDSLREGYSNGEDMRQLSKRVKDTWRVNRHRATRMARTVTNEVYNGAHQYSISNFDAAWGYQFEAVIDSRTTDICRAYNQNIYHQWDIRDGRFQRPPLHFNCRSRLLPYFDEIPDDSDPRRRTDMLYTGEELDPNTSRKIYEQVDVFKNRYWLGEKKLRNLNTILQQKMGTKGIMSGREVRERILQIDEDMHKEALQTHRGLKKKEEEYKKLAEELVNTKRSMLDETGEMHDTKYTRQLLNQLEQLSIDISEQKKKISKIAMERKKRIWNTIFLRNDDNVDFDLNIDHNLNSRMTIEKVNEQIETARKFVGKTVAKEQLRYRPKVSADIMVGRAFSSKTDVMAGVNDKARVYVHELGHTLEYANPESVRTASNMYLRYKARGKPLKTLNELKGTTRFDKYEQAFEIDDFPDYYAAKKYEGGGTEIMSIGFEKLFVEPEVLAKEYPEFFEFVVDNARGRGMIKIEEFVRKGD